MTWRSGLLGLIVVSGLLRLGWAASLGLGNDEAYHYLFTTHPDWSYFDHPPMLAVVGSLGPALAGGEASALRLRLGFVLLFAGSTWLMARLTSRFYGPGAGFLAALALNLSAYYTVAAGAFVLPDGPLLFFWLLTLDRLAVALETPGRPWPWVAVGLAWGGALLSKYHAVFLPAGTILYILLEPSARPWLRRRGPHLALAVGVLVFSPVIWWNATHEWISFAFQGGRALGGVRVHPEALAGAMVGQVAYLLPWIWAPLVAILVRGGRRLAGDLPSADRFLLCQSVLPLAAFTAVACTRPVLPHWTLVGFLSLFPLLGRAWHEGLAADPARRTWRLALHAALTVLIAAIFLLWADTGLFQKGKPGAIGLVRVSRDPTVDLFGWDQVARELERRGLLDRPGTFLFTSYWYNSAQLAFATRHSRTPVLCYNSWDSRNFAFWSRPDDWVGRDGILVALNDRSTEPHCFDRWFTRIEPIGAFEVVRAGVPVRKVRLFRCVRQTESFPFDNLRRPRAEYRRLAEGKESERRRSRSGQAGRRRGPFR
ncbi:MAG: glycosyltransferase family 39 protein [Planctomycetaceae bacterium]|nr:glycosyltransferase family 39 protein [Planctomycetaceae bacterium]